MSLIADREDGEQLLRRAVSDIAGGRVRVLAVGAQPDLRSALAATDLLASYAETAEAVEIYALSAIDVLVVDAGSWSPASWSSLRALPELCDLPLLLVGEAQLALEAYGASDLVERSALPLYLERRARTLGEAARARRLAALAERTLETSPGMEARVLRYREGGNAHWSSLQLQPIHGADGRVRWLLGVEEGTGEQQAPPSFSFLDLILEELPAGVLTADRMGRATYVNRVGIETLGLARGAWRGQPARELLGLPAEIVLGEERSRHAYAFRRPDGRELELGVTLSRAQGVHPDVDAFVLFRDLTADRESELASRRQGRLAAIGTMVAGFAHEVRNPLSAMRSLLEMLDEDTPAGDPRRPSLARLLRHLERIERLMKSSLKFGHPDEPCRVRSNPVKLVEVAIELLRPRTRDFGDFRVELSRPLPEVYVDDAMISQALVALLNNALDAATFPDQVVVRATRREQDTEEAVCIEVEDFGPGIPRHVLERIFDPFFTTKAGGTGLGLSIAQRLVHDNRGSLQVSTRPGLGSTFSILLPSARGIGA